MFVLKKDFKTLVADKDTLIRYVILIDYEYIFITFQISTCYKFAQLVEKYPCIIMSRYFGCKNVIYLTLLKAIISSPLCKLLTHSSIQVGINKSCLFFCFVFPFEKG